VDEAHLLGYQGNFEMNLKKRQPERTSLESEDWVRGSGLRRLISTGTDCEKNDGNGQQQGTCWFAFQRDRNGLMPCPSLLIHGLVVEPQNVKIPVNIGGRPIPNGLDHRITVGERWERVGYRVHMDEEGGLSTMPTMRSVTRQILKVSVKNPSSSSSRQGLGSSRPRAATLNASSRWYNGSDLHGGDDW